MTIENADVMFIRPNLFNVVITVDLSHATLKCIYRNLIWALIYNVLAIPIAAGLSIPLFQMIIPPWIAGVAMLLSSLSVLFSSLLLFYYQPPNQSTYLNPPPNQSTAALSNSSTNSYQGLPDSVMSTTVDSPLPSIQMKGLESLLSFADGYLEMEEGKSLLSDKKKKSYGSNADSRV